jgi:flavin reductase (DIM6/NTAB) family NADH-FMN oxidoreductase RutF
MVPQLRSPDIWNCSAPFCFVSTKSQDEQSDNLSPFSYFQVVDHDPPVFVIGFTGRAERPKDNVEESHGDRRVHS